MERENCSKYDPSRDLATRFWQTLRIFALVAAFAITSLRVTLSDAESLSAPSPIHLGFIGSLSAFAASYGTAVLDGARLAIDELAARGIKVDLSIEDDQSSAKDTVNSYVKLSKVDGVKGIVGGTWWANSIVKLAEHDNLPLLSCETLYNDDAVAGKSYFILHGDLREWVRVYEPLVKSRSWTRGAIIQFSSGFSATLAREMKSLFSQEGRKFVGAVEYSDIEMSEAAGIVLKLKKLNPDVVYVDAQPSGLATFLKRLSEAGMTHMNVLTHSIADDVRRDKLVDLSKYDNLYFTRRVSFDPDFIKLFTEKYKKQPYLGSDLGYYSVLLLVEALKSPNPVARIKEGMTVREKSFTFDNHNVFSGIPQEVFRIDGENAVKWSDKSHENS